MRLAEQDEMGITVRDHLVALYRNTGRVDELLVLPPIPRCLAALWDLFCALASQRQGGLAGMQPLAWVDVASYCALTGVRMNPWEVETLRQIDGACVRAAKAIANERHRRSLSSRGSKH